MADRTLTCIECGEKFVFTEGEQEFYREKGFDNEPKRCLKCRKTRRNNRHKGPGNSSGSPGNSSGNKNRF